MASKPEFNGLTHAKAVRSSTVLPTSYDLRGTDYISDPVKKQIISEPCCVFGTIGSLESAYLKSGATSADFSERYLSGNHGFEYDECDGGNMKIATVTFTKWNAKCEFRFPYPESPSYTVNWSTNIFIMHPFLRDARYLPRCDDNGFDTAIIKQAIIDHGALYTNMRYESASYNSSNHTHYYSGTENTNHGVLLVGWDDNKATTASSNVTMYNKK